MQAILIKNPHYLGKNCSDSLAQYLLVCVHVFIIWVVCIHVFELCEYMHLGYMNACIWVVRMRLGCVHAFGLCVFGL